MGDKLNWFMKKTVSIYAVAAVVGVLLLTVNQVWAADISGQSSGGKTDAMIAAADDSAVNEPADDMWSQGDNWDDEWGEEETIADPLLLPGDPPARLLRTSWGNRRSIP